MTVALADFETIGLTVISGVADFLDILLTLDALWLPYLCVILCPNVEALPFHSKPENHPV